MAAPEMLDTRSPPGSVSEHWQHPCPAHFHPPGWNILSTALSNAAFVSQWLKMTGRWERGTKRAIHLGRLPYRNQTKSQHKLLLHAHESQPFVKDGAGGKFSLCDEPAAGLRKGKSFPLPRQQENPQALNNHSCSTPSIRNSRKSAPVFSPGGVIFRTSTISKHLLLTSSLQHTPLTSH